MSELRASARRRASAQAEAKPQVETVVKPTSMLGLDDTVTVAAVIAPRPEPVAIRGGGLPGAHRLAIQVCLRQQNHKMCGAAVSTMKGKAHRLEVTRLVPYATMTEEQNDVLRWRIAKAASDDGMLRPKRRKSLVMFEGGPEGMTTQKSAWGAAYDAVTTCLQWAERKLSTMRGTEQLGLLMVVHISDWETKNWKDANDQRHYFDEAHVRAIEYVELVDLVEPTLDVVDDDDDLTVDFEEK